MISSCLSVALRLLTGATAEVGPDPEDCWSCVDVRKCAKAARAGSPSPGCILSGSNLAEQSAGEACLVWLLSWPARPERRWMSFGKSGSLPGLKSKVGLRLNSAETCGALVIYMSSCLIWASPHAAELYGSNNLLCRQCCLLPAACALSFSMLLLVRVALRCAAFSRLFGLYARLSHGREPLSLAAALRSRLWQPIAPQCSCGGSHDPHASASNNLSLLFCVCLRMSCRQNKQWSGIRVEVKCCKCASLDLPLP